MRWKGLLFLFFLLGLFLAISLIFADSWLEAKFEDLGTSIVGAKVEVDGLDFSISGARGILFNVSGGDDLSLAEINEAANIITKNADSRAKVIFGAVHDKNLQKEEIKITVIATGFDKR